jgi:phage-related minor tail protein
MEAARATMAQAEAQIQAARSAGAQSFALAALREGTESLAAAQARHAALMGELAVLGQQQARINTSIAATAAAAAAAENAAASATAGLAAAKNSASWAVRGFGSVVGALGGPVGVAIIAVSALAMWLAKLKSNADEAAKAGTQIERAQRVAAAGGKPEDRDIAPLRQGLEQWKSMRDDLLSSGKDSMTKWVNGAPVTYSMTALNAGIADMEKRLAMLDNASQRVDNTTQNVTLTLEGTEQAWRKANAEVKTAGSIQEEYAQKLQASKSSFAQLKEMLEKQGASQATINERTKRQAENEAGLAKERDKQLKALAGNSEAAATRANRRGIEAQIEAVREGYKLMALQTSDGIDAIDSLRKRDLLSEYGAIQRRRELQLLDLANREAALKRELELAKGDKDSAKKQEGLTGQIREVQQLRVNTNNKADRDLEEVLVAPQLSLLNTTRQATEAIHEQAAAQEAQNTVHVKTQEAVSKIASAQDALNAMQNQSKAALIDLNIAQMERLRTDLEATDSVIPGYIEMLEKRIAAEKRLRDATSASEGLDKADEVRKKQLDEARKTSEDIRGVFRQGVMDALDNNGNAFASIGTSLKRTVVTALADAFYDATLKQAVDGLAQTVTQALKGTSGVDAAKGGGGGGLLGALWSGVSTFLGFGAKTPTPNAKGGAYAAAGLSAYSSTLVDRPTLFPFAKGGVGLMGEAGTEGIFPLKRDSQGRLGVIGSSAGEGASLHYAPVNNFYIDSQADRGAVMADLGRAMQVNNQRQLEGLQRLGVAPR